MPKQTYTNFLSGLHNYKSKELIPANAGQIFDTIDISKGSLIPLKQSSPQSVTPPTSAKIAYDWQGTVRFFTAWSRFMEIDNHLYHLSGGNLKKMDTSGTTTDASLKGLYSTGHSISTGSTTNYYDYSIAITNYDPVTGDESGAALYEVSGKFLNVSFDPAFVTTFNSQETFRCYLKINGPDGATYGRPNNTWIRFSDTVTSDSGKTLDKISISSGVPNLVYTDSTTKYFTGEVIQDTPPLAGRDTPEDLQDFAFYGGALFVVEEDSTTIYFTDPYKYSTWSELNTLKVDENVVGMFPSISGLVVTTKNRTYLITGTNADSYAINEISNRVGCINKSTMANYNGTVVWLSRDGIVALSNFTLMPLTKDQAVIEWKDITSDRIGYSFVWDGIYYLMNSPTTDLSTESNYQDHYAYEFLTDTLKTVPNRESLGNPYYSAFIEGDSMVLLGEDDLYDMFEGSIDDSLHYKSPKYLVDANNRIRVKEVTVTTKSVVGSPTLTVHTDSNTSTSTLSADSINTLKIAADKQVCQGVEVEIDGQVKVLSYAIEYVVLSLDGNKQLHTHLVIEHDDAATFGVYDSGDNLIETRTIAANEGKSTSIALNNTIVDYFAYISSTDSDITDYNFITNKIETTLRTFATITLDFTGSVDMQIKKSDGSNLFGSAVSLSSSGRVKRIINLPDETYDTNLFPVFSNTGTVFNYNFTVVEPEK